MIRLQVVLILLLTSAWVSAKPLYVPADVRIDISLTDSVSYLFTESERSLENVQQYGEAQWRPLADAGASLGYNANALWLRLDLSSARERELLLILNYPILDEVDLYLLQGEQMQKQSTGDHQPLAERWLQHRKLILPVNLQSGIPARLYLRIYGQSSYTVPMNLLDPHSFFEKDADQTLFYGGLFGAGLVMILFNLFLGVTLRQAAYLYYVLFTLSFTMFGFTIEGFARFYLWQNMPLLSDMTIVLWGQLGGISYALFLTKFLPLKKHFFQALSDLYWFRLGSGDACLVVISGVLPANANSHPFFKCIVCPLFHGANLSGLAQWLYRRKICVLGVVISDGCRRHQGAVGCRIFAL